MELPWPNIWQLQWSAQVSICSISVMSVCEKQCTVYLQQHLHRSVCMGTCMCVSGSVCIVLEAMTSLLDRQGKVCETGPSQEENPPAYLPSLFSQSATDEKCASYSGPFQIHTHTEPKMQDIECTHTSLVYTLQFRTCSI